MKQSDEGERRRWGYSPLDKEFTTIVNGSPEETKWTPTRDELTEWLKSKHVGTWGNYTISESGRMDAAIDWFLAQVEELHEFTGR